MVKYKVEFRKWQDLDIKTLARISAVSRRVEGLGDYTVEEVEEHLQTMQERFPAETFAIAFEESEAVGWMGVERVTENIGEVGRWQPFVISENGKREIAQQLISSIVNYASSNEMTRIEVAFGGISDENLATFKTRCEWYETKRWRKLEDTNFMACDPMESQLDENPPLVGFDLRPLLEFDNDTIFECYHEAFTTGDARWIYDMTEEERRQEFDKVFDRSHNVNEDASFAILAKDEIVGFILIVTRSEEEEHLESIGIKPEFRGRGLSKILLRESLETLVDQEKRNLTLGVDPVNVPAVGLYETFGFETVSRIARYSWKSDESEPTS